MRIHNLYTDTSGELHFRDIEVEWVEEREAASFPSACLPPGSSFARRKLSMTSTGTRHRAGNTSSISTPG